MKFFHIIVVTMLILAPNGMASNALGADTSRELQKAVHKLNFWLGQSDRADAWRRLLDLNSLEAQSAKGTRADIGKLSEINNRFATHYYVLHLAPFNDAKIAIQNHISSLSASQDVDIIPAIAAAKANYRPVTIPEIERSRDEAVYELGILKRYYNSRVESEKRAELSTEIQLEAMLPFLRELNFELPPDISVGKLKDQLDLMKSRISDVERKLDELPETDELETVPPQPDEGPAITPPATDRPVKAEKPSADSPSEEKSTDKKDPEPNSDGNRADDNEAADEDALDEKTSPSKDRSEEETLTATQEQDADKQGADDEPETDEPEMDDEQSRRQRAELIDELAHLNEGLKELETLRASVLAEDRDRQRMRAQVWRQIGKFNKGIVETSQIQNDYYFSAFQHSFYKFALLYFYGTDDNLQVKYNEKLDVLAQEINKLPMSSERDAAATVGNIIGWLDATEQAPELCRLIERNFSLPNVTFSVTRSFVNRVGGRSVHESRSVNEMIMGRLIQGHATVNGNVDFDFVDDPNQAQINLHLLGNIQSQTHTSQGRITGFAEADVRIEAWQNIAANIGGLVVGNPVGSACVNSRFCGVDSPIRLIQKIARKQYRRDKAESERISGRKIERQFLSQFAQQTNEAVSQGRQRIATARSEVAGLGGYFPELYLRTTSDRLWAIGHKTVFKLAHSGRVSNLAATTRSTGSSVNADVAIQLHESALSNYADEIFNSRTFTNDQLAEEAQEITGEVPEGLATGEDEESWSITFSDARPIRFEFEDNRMAVTISGRRFSQGENRIQAGLKIRIPFIVERSDGVLKLIREGEAEITYMEPDRINAKIVAFKSFLETKLNSFEKRDTARPGFVLPNNLIPMDEVERLKEFKLGRELQLVELRMQEGWLYVGWNHVAPGTYFSHIIDMPGIWDASGDENDTPPVGSTDAADVPETNVSQTSTGE